MTSLANHHSDKFVKFIYIGDSGTGKTGSLVSLVEAGYKFYIVDLDNGLESLRGFVSKQCPKLVNNIEYETIRDKVVPTSRGPVVQASAYLKAIKLLDKWSDETELSKVGPEAIVVVDSLTAFGRAAFEWQKKISPGVKDPRQWFYAAQQCVEYIVQMLTSAEYEANVILITHINYKQIQEGVEKGYPSSIGTALGPVIPKYFNTLVMAETEGSGKNVQRIIRTTPTGIVDLKNPRPFSMEARYPLGTGLANIFETLKGE